MISWMQKHNKYLVVTIWIATIAFIGAGFVGWGSYQYGSKTGNIARVGDIDITGAKFDITYKNLYARYNEQFEGKLDEKKAKELGIASQTLNQLKIQANILNLAKEFGIVVSDDELADIIAHIEGFQKDGQFNKSIYEGYLQNQGIKAKNFEEFLRDETIIKKTLTLLESGSAKEEQDVFNAILSLSDKIRYKVLTPNDINITADATKTKLFWEEHKMQYMTDKKYTLDILWTDAKETNVTQTEVEEFYKQNSYNYLDSNGSQLQFEQAREAVTIDVKMEKTKKVALKQYIEYKNNKIQKSQTLTLSLGDPTLSQEMWAELEQKAINDIIKPKAVVLQYATVKIVAIETSREMRYEEASKFAENDYIKNAKLIAIEELAKNTLKNIDKSDAKVTDFLSIDTVDNLDLLTKEESLQFLQKLFTSQKEDGIIPIKEKSVVYKIIDQRLSTSESNVTKIPTQTIDQIKRQSFESALLKSLENKYDTEVFVEGL